MSSFNNIKVYIIGGIRGKNVIKDASKYDIENDKWEHIPQLN